MPLDTCSRLSFDQLDAINALRRVLLSALDDIDETTRMVRFSAADEAVIRAWIEATK